MFIKDRKQIVLQLGWRGSAEVRVMKTNEERMIARHTNRILRRERAIAARRR